MEGWRTTWRRCRACVGFAGAGRRYALVQGLAADLGNTVAFGCLASGGVLHVLDADAAVDPRAWAGYVAARRH